MRFRLTADHLIDDTIYPPGTIIGEGTMIDFRELDPEGKPRWRTPSMFMEPEDEEARQVILKRNKLLADKGARAELPVPPLVNKPGDLIPGQGPGGERIPSPEGLQRLQAEREARLPPMPMADASLPPASRSAATPTPAAPAAMQTPPVSPAAREIGKGPVRAVIPPSEPAETVKPDEKPLKPATPTIDKTLPK